MGPVTLGILGCGYTGLRVATVWRSGTVGPESFDPDRASAAGAPPWARAGPIRGTTRSTGRLDDLAGWGIEGWTADLARGIPEPFFQGLEHVIHLAPPPTDEGELDRQVDALAATVRRAAPGLKSFVYGSTTGAFGQQSDGDWVDEDTPAGPMQPRGARRARYEARLRSSGLPVRIVRIAAIYGPGRGMPAALDRGMVLFEGGPLTSRIHVEDLARLLVAMTGPDVPAMVVGCDEEPARTVEVAEFCCRITGRAMPEVVSKEAALRDMSPQARELRTAGRRCRSRHRPGLIGALRHPSYREGLRASVGVEAD